MYPAAWAFALDAVGHRQDAAGSCPGEPEHRAETVDEHPMGPPVGHPLEARQYLRDASQKAEQGANYQA